MPLRSTFLQPEPLRYAMDSYRVSTKAQFGRARTHFLYLGGGAIPHRQDSSPSHTKPKQKAHEHKQKTKRKTTNAQPRTLSAQSTSSCGRSRQPGSLSSALPAMPAQTWWRFERATSSVKSARQRTATTCCWSSRMTRTSYAKSAEEVWKGSGKRRRL